MSGVQTPQLCCVQWSRAGIRHSGDCWYMRGQASLGAELDRMHDAITDRDARIIVLETALQQIKTRGDQWLANDHDYSTPYADRPEGDRVASSMHAVARAALEAK